MDRKGYFIAFEGIDGLGKSTQLAEVARVLTQAGFEVRTSREPTDSEYGRAIRCIAQHGRQDISPDEELALFVKDRALDVETNILPGLARGAVVLVDRYFYSNLAYQGALGVAADRIREANAGFPVPDLVLLFDAPPEVGIARIRQGRGEANNQGYEQADFLARVRERFAAMIGPNVVRIDATREAPAITQEVREIVLERLREKGLEITKTT